jgi:putative transposase
MDAYSRLLVGRSIAEHLRTELVTDALVMAIIRRQPDERYDNGWTILQSDQGLAVHFFGLRSTPARRGLLASIGTVDYSTMS